MGDPRKIRRQYSRPQHLWREERITEEDALCKKYGLKNKKEIWKARTNVRKIREHTRRLLAMERDEAKRGEKELLSKLIAEGLAVKNLEDVLALKVEDLLDRRLESLVRKKGLANTAKQARQFITHGHVLVRGKVVSIPSYLVAKDEEEEIARNDEIKIISPSPNKKRRVVKFERRSGRRNQRRRR